MATSNIEFPSAYKPGGCIQITSRTTQGRITMQGSDELGRWTYVGLATKDKNMIFIITAYKPCQPSSKPGPLTVHSQQWSMLRAKNIEYPNPRQEFNKDFIAFVEELQSKSHRIIIVGDFNETRESSTLLQSLYHMGIRDMVASRHTNMPPFRSCNKGQNIIDYALCSSTLLPLIRASTYEPFMLNTTSDHRGIVIDFNTRSLMGRQEHIVSPDRRGINSNNPIQVERFLEELQKDWEKYNIAQRIHRAYNTITDTTSLRKLVNELDQDITKAMLRAERKVRKSERPPWSPALKQASLLVKYYKLIRHQQLHKTNMSATIQHVKQQLDTVPTDPRHPQEHQTLLRKAQKALRKIRRDAQQHRDQHLEILLKRYGLLDDEHMQKTIRRLIRAEATKRCYNKLKQITKPPKPGVTFVEQTSPDGNTVTLYDRKTLEHAILQRNQKHFNQCAGTPFTIGQLRKLNWAADSPLADEILKGDIAHTISPNRLVQQVLQQCKQTGPAISDHISTGDLQQLFKTWRESTTTSPSGRHLGLYRAIFNNHTPSEEQPSMAYDITALINLLIQNGLGLDRWRHVTNMMIHKLDGSYNINKLRVIHLFEADYNGLIGILFNRRVLYQAEHKQLINNNQWGGRPHKQAEDALMLKELTYNIANATRTTLATFDNDATGCFDRVPCTVAMLSSRRLGATKNMCRMQADTLRHIQHKLRTAFGTSQASYTSNDQCEIHGQGQGSRAGPPTWVFVSSLLLDCMQQLANGLHFTCPKKEIHHRRTNDAFVDDVTGYTNNFVHELEGEYVQHTVVELMQQDASLWNELLHISGGKLALHKCLYYVLAWKWHDGQATLKPASEIQPKITLHDGQESTPIEHLEPNQAHRTLGQFKSPTGDQTFQLTHMTKKSLQWLTAISQATLTKHEAQAAYETMWFPSLSYGLGTTNLSYAELDAIQRPIINHILPSLGYNRHLPRAVVFGSSKFGCMNLKHLYIDQGIKHVTQFIKYLRNGGSIKRLITISLRWLHQIAGFSFCPLARPRSTYHHIEDRWYQTTLRFLFECNARIETSEHIDIYCRDHDSCLMEDFMLTDHTPSELKQLNYCRLFLRVVTLSDICTAKGDTITRQCWEGSTPTNATQLWPRQESPATKSWSVWRRFISTCYLQNESSSRKTRRDLRLATPLGSWLPNHQQRHIRPYYINPTSRTIYHHAEDLIKVFAPCRNTRTQISYRPTGYTSYCPLSTIPIDCHPSSDCSSNIYVFKKDIPTPHPHTQTTVKSFNDHINTLDHWEHQLLQTTNFQCSPDNQHIVISTDIIIASDGSVRDQTGSFGWVITDTNGQIIVTGSGTAFGYDITSFRSEAYGILAPLRFLYQLQCYYSLPIHPRRITWYCDSESLLKRIQSHQHDTHNPNRYKLADNDLEEAIISSIALVTTNLHKHHIRSHQHDHVPLHCLPLPQRLNRIADELATNAHNSHNHDTTRVPLITPAVCQLHTKHGTITRSYYKILHEAFTDKTTTTHICNRLQIGQATIHYIAWNEFARAFRGLTPGQKRTVRKWIFGYLPTQTRLSRYNYSSSNLCPICKQSDETDSHFLICGGSTSWQETLFEPLKLMCHKQHAPSTFESHLLTQLKAFLDGTTPDDSVQSTLGWTAIFYGLFAQQWITIINQHHQLTNGSSLITKTIKIILSSVAARWNERCRILHKEQLQSSENRERLQHQIQVLYACKDDVLFADQDVFKTPLNDLLQKPSSALKAYISHYKPLIKRSVRLRQAQIKRQHKDIASYFIRTSSTRGSL